MILDIIVLTLISLLGYTWVGYPVLLTIVSKRKAESGEKSLPAPTYVGVFDRSHRLTQMEEKEKTQVSGLPLRCASDTKHLSPFGRVSPHPLPFPSPISIILAAHNEEGVIGARLENLVDVIGGRDVQVYVGLDGCIDDTAKAAGEVAKHHDNIHVCAFDERRGKVAVLKELVEKAEGGNLKPENGEEKEGEKKVLQEGQEELPADHADYTDKKDNSDTSPILVFTDANTHFKADALDKLLAPFDDPTIGGVCGRLVFTVPGEKNLTTDYTDGTDKRVNPDTLLNLSSANSAPLRETSLAPEGSYWRWETKLKTAESRLDSCLGANGAIYAVREELFWSDIPDNTVVDDFVIGMKVREQGLRMIYEPSAVAEEELPELSNEWGRRIRIGSGDYQALALCSRCLSSRYGKFAWSFWSHKVLRWVTPHMLLLLISGFWLLVGSGWLFYDQNGYFRSTFSVALGMAGSGMTAVFILSALLGSMLRDGKGQEVRGKGVNKYGGVGVSESGSEKSKSPEASGRGQASEKEKPQVSGLSLQPSLSSLNSWHAARRAVMAYFRLCDHFMTMQAALFVGFIRYCRGDLKGFWTRTPRG